MCEKKRTKTSNFAFVIVFALFHNNKTKHYNKSEKEFFGAFKINDTR